MAFLSVLGQLMELKFLSGNLPKTPPISSTGKTDTHLIFKQRVTIVTALQMLLLNGQAQCMMRGSLQIQRLTKC